MKTAVCIMLAFASMAATAPVSIQLASWELMKKEVNFLHIAVENFVEQIKETARLGGADEKTLNEFIVIMDAGSTKALREVHMTKDGIMKEVLTVEVARNHFKVIELVMETTFQELAEPRKLISKFHSEYMEVLYKMAAEICAGHAKNIINLLENNSSSRFSTMLAIWEIMKVEIRSLRLTVENFTDDVKVSAKNLGADESTFNTISQVLETGNIKAMKPIKMAETGIIEETLKFETANEYFKMFETIFEETYKNLEEPCKKLSDKGMYVEILYKIAAEKAFGHSRIILSLIANNTGVAGILHVANWDLMEEKVKFIRLAIEVFVYDTMDTARNSGAREEIVDKFAEILGISNKTSLEIVELVKNDIMSKTLSYENAQQYFGILEDIASVTFESLRVLRAQIPINYSEYMVIVYNTAFETISVHVKTIYSMLLMDALEH